VDIIIDIIFHTKDKGLACANPFLLKATAHVIYLGICSDPKIISAARWLPASEG